MTTAAAMPDTVVLTPPTAAPESRAFLYSDTQRGDDTQRDDTPAILERLRLTAGITQPWDEAVLRAIGQWTLPSEIIAGHRWQYVIGGEALDWITLAHRLSAEIPDAIPPRDLEALLFCGRLPGAVDPERFRRLIGTYRYTAHLNYQYGVVVEEALQLAVEESVRKHHLALCYGDSAAIMRETYRHLYGDTEDALYRQFAAAAGEQQYDDGATLSLSGYREFTYWLFKRRIRKWHPARVASDTRRGLDKLRELRAGGANDRAADDDMMAAPEWDAAYALPVGGA